MYQFCSFELQLKLAKNESSHLTVIFDGSTAFHTVTAGDMFYIHACCCHVVNSDAHSILYAEQEACKTEMFVLKE